MNWTDIIYLMVILVAWHLLITRVLPKMGYGGG